MNPRECPYCGFVLHASESVCENCGYDFHTDPAPEVVKHVERERARRTRVQALIGLIGGAFLVYLFPDWFLRGAPIPSDKLNVRMFGLGIWMFSCLYALIRGTWPTSLIPDFFSGPEKKWPRQ